MSFLAWLFRPTFSHPEWTRMNIISSVVCMLSPQLARKVSDSVGPLKTKQFTDCDGEGSGSQTKHGWTALCLLFYIHDSSATLLTCRLSATPDVMQCLSTSGSWSKSGSLAKKQEEDYSALCNNVMVSITWYFFSNRMFDRANHGCFMPAS